MGRLDGLRRGGDLELGHATVALRAQLHVAAQRRGQGIFGGRQRLAEIGMDDARAWGPPLGPGGSGIARAAFGLAHRPGAVAGLEAERAPLGVVLAQQDGASVALAEVAVLDQLDGLLSEEVTQAMAL